MGFYLAFPHRHDLPAKRSQFTGYFAIALHVLIELILPEGHSAFWRVREFTAMPMPKTAVDE